MKLQHFLAPAALGAVAWLAAASPSFAVNAAATQLVNARSCGSTDCEVLYQLPAGTQVTVIAQQDGWCQAEWTGYPTAWVSCQYLTALGAAQQQRNPTSPPARNNDDDDNCSPNYSCD